MQYHKKRARSEESISKIINYLWSMAFRIMRSQKASLEESCGKIMKSI